MQKFRRLTYMNAKKGGYLSVSIPVELCPIFHGTNNAIVEATEDGMGIVVRPARVLPIVQTVEHRYRS
jgi:hypothetical protein